MKEPKVYIMLVNFNGWRDTVECLESLLKLDYTNYQILVCDNGSTNASWDNLLMWAEGKLDCSFLEKTCFKSIVYPVEKKPISYCAVTEEEGHSSEYNDKNQSKIVFIKSNINRGFAGGNNLCIKYAQHYADYALLWMLNNDTVVDKDTLKVVVSKVNMDDSNISMIGTDVYYYHNPTEKQCSGVFCYNKWIGSSKMIKDSIDNDTINNAGMLYGVYGASCFLTRNFVERIEQLNEEYFLYYEEQDLGIESKNNKMQLDVVSVIGVYHKEGSSIGGNSANKSNKSFLSDYFSIRNRIGFTKRYYWYCLPTVYLGLFIAILNRIKRKQYDRILLIIKLMFGIDVPAMENKGK